MLGEGVFAFKRHSERVSILDRFGIVLVKRLGGVVGLKCIILNGKSQIKLAEIGKTKEAGNCKPQE